MRLDPGGLCLCILGVAAVVTRAEEANAYCRTTACPLPPDFTPSDTSCYPDNFAATCASASPPVKPLVVWWRNQCVSYDLQKKASQQVSYDDAAKAVAAAFAKWTGVTCPEATGPARVSIDVRDLGPVECGQVQYSSDQGNQHVIFFHDDVWPHGDSANTLGLTTITFAPQTGEIYDADMELNATRGVQLSIADSVPVDGYDLESIVTHEAGHFLGMAHSGDPSATMYARYVPGTVSMRTLTSDDMTGICSIYPPDGVRLVDPTVQSGKVAETSCDPTPRHGFQSTCAHAIQHGCSATPGGAPTLWAGSANGAIGAIGAVLASLALRRRMRHA